MTMILNNGTSPKVELKTHKNELHLMINDEVESMAMFAEISPKDVIRLVTYWLTNTDLNGLDDVRLDLIEWIKSLKKINGYNSGGFRLSPK